MNALVQSSWIIARAARSLGISSQALRLIMNSAKIERPEGAGRPAKNTNCPVYHKPPISQFDKFEEIVRRGPNNACWLWPGPRNAQGYGIVCAEGKAEGAHRVSYKIHRGKIPRGKLVLHDCDNPPCVNPDHLHLGDQKMNSMEAASRGRIKYPHSLR